jgi:GntR family transcriptional repressor for pyruvate dehydrogenase complex
LLKLWRFTNLNRTKFILMEDKLMNQFTPLTKKRASHYIAEKIKEAIENNIYQPGDQLPSEREMAESFQVSRTVVRESLSFLQASNIIEVKPGKGVFLKKTSTQSILEAFNRLLDADTYDLVELLELRRGLETEIIRLAVDRATSEDIERIESAYLLMEEKMLKHEVALDEDFQFHKVIAEASHNQLMLKVFYSIVDHYRHGLQQARKKSIHNPDQNIEVLNMHKDLYLAIKHKNQGQAQGAILQLLDHVYKKLTSHQY